MTIIASTWLFFSLVLCVYAWIGKKSYLVLPPAVVGLAMAMYVPTGSARPTRPPEGRYTVLGAEINVGVDVRVLLKGVDGRTATYYVMPYDEDRAASLQKALDIGYQQGGRVMASFGGDGPESYDGEPPVRGDESKTVETPSVEVPE